MVHPTQLPISIFEIENKTPTLGVWAMCPQALLSVWPSPSACLDPELEVTSDI